MGKRSCQKNNRRGRKVIQLQLQSWNSESRAQLWDYENELRHFFFTDGNRSWKVLGNLLSDADATIFYKNNGSWEDPKSTEWHQFPVPDFCTCRCLVCCCLLCLSVLPLSGNCIPQVLLLLLEGNLPQNSVSIACLAQSCTNGLHNKQSPERVSFSCRTYFKYCELIVLYAIPLVFLTTLYSIMCRVLWGKEGGNHNIANHSQQVCPIKCFPFQISCSGSHSQTASFCCQDAHYLNASLFPLLHSNSR